MQIGIGLAMGQVCGPSLVQRAIGILAKYGTNAHVYLPGIGTINGLTAGNYLDSGGVTPATVDNPVGLGLDALQAMALGSEQAPALQSGLWGTVQIGWAVGSGVATVDSSAGGTTAILNGAAVTGKTYRCDYTIASVSGTGVCGFVGGASGTFRTSPGSYTDIIVATGAGGFGLKAGNSNTLATITAVSVREIPGIHASQGTTANKCLLRLTSGKYNWVFDSTDLLTATFPAGNESVTVIDSFLTGQVTTTGVNVVGAYSMGPSVTLYGRMIIKGSISASDLLVLQRFANSWAGL